jgi:hypothetical protein
MSQSTRSYKLQDQYNEDQMFECYSYPNIGVIDERCCDIGVTDGTHMNYSQKDNFGNRDNW